MAETAEGTQLWEPSETFKENARISDYMKWLKAEKDLAFEDYNDLWEWSVTDIDGFWGSSLWEFFDIQSSEALREGVGTAGDARGRVVPGGTVNYAEHVCRTRERADDPATWTSPS